MSEPFSINKNMGENSMNLFLTKRQVCDRYNISHMTLEKWKDKGLKFYKFGNSRTSMIKYKIEHLEDFLEKHLVSID